MKEFVVVIDPGHGGKDYGAIGEKANEKDINLAVSLLLGDKILSASKNIKVVYTRSTDEFIPLNDRAKVANKAKGDLFISIHVNSVAKKNKNRTKIAGSEVYTVGLHKSEDNLAVAQRENSVMMLEEDYSETYSGFDPNSIESYIAFELNQSRHIDRSIQFAAEVQNHLVAEAGRVDKGVKQAGFWVLWATGMPSVLVELDFICNPTSEKFLASIDGQEKLVTSIYNAFVHYYNSVSGDNIKPMAPQRAKYYESQENKAHEVSKESEDKSDKDSEGKSEEEHAEENVGEPTLIVADQQEFRVQILTSSSPLKDNASQFKGVKDAEFYIDKGLYKYTVGHFTSEADANKKLRELKSKFKDAFVIKMINGQRVQ